jgi:double-stranded uracil-DNA glycosylase
LVVPTDPVLTRPTRPTKADLAAAAGKFIRPVIAPGLDILFVGINPGLYSGATGHHFARPGNRFWPALHHSGLTPRQLAPHENRLLLEHGLGIVNIVQRTTAAESDLEPEEFRAGAVTLRRQLLRYRPKVAAFLGLGAYSRAFEVKKVQIGDQAHTIGATRLWALPNPSGLNANYQMPDFVRLFRELHAAAKSI